MSSAVDKDIAFFTCSCEEGLLRVDYFEWKYKCDDVDGVHQEFGINFVEPCFSRFIDRLKMIWHMINGRPVYYLTLKREDATRLGAFLLTKGITPEDKKLCEKILLPKQRDLPCRRQEHECKRNETNSDKK